MRKWIIINCDYGQLGNRLHTHANALAWCLENNYNLLNLSFRPFVHYFKKVDGRPVDILVQNSDVFSRIFLYSFVRNILRRFCMSDKWLNRLSEFIEVLHCDENQVLNEADLSSAMQNSKRLILIRAWNLNCSYTLTIHDEAIRGFLSPTCACNNLATEFLSKLKSEYDIIIGVHARRGDYKEYLGGRHYHSWQSYIEWILQAKKLFEQEREKKVGFIICSDENLDESHFSYLPVYFLPQKEIYTDIITLSLCDYNVGPPSSFGTWISWYGKVPRCIVESNTVINSYNSFSICKYC